MFLFSIKKTGGILICYSFNGLIFNKLCESKYMTGEKINIAGNLIGRIYRADVTLTVSVIILFFFWFRFF